MIQSNATAAVAVARALLFASVNSRFFFGETERKLNSVLVHPLARRVAIKF
jgi:hypothetical protein